MHRFATLFLLAPAAGFASDPLACVDPEFVRAFFAGNDSSPVSYSTEVPERFEVRRPPPDMTLIGSRNEDHAATVIYRSDRSVRDAYASLVEVLSGQAWQDITYERTPSRRGFQSSDRYRVAEYCREKDDTNLAVTVSERYDETLVSIHQFDRKTMFGCMGTLRARNNDLMDRMPVLVPPDGATTSNVRRIAISHEISSSVDVTTDIGREALLEIFGEQIEDQGWTPQAKWSGVRSSGSAWSRDTPDHGLLVGTLHLYDSGANPVRARFSVDSTDPDKDFDHGYSVGMPDGCE